jgi:hypothetical protein
MKAYGGADVQTHIFSTSALSGSEWSASHPCHFTPGKKPPVPIVEETGWTPEPVWTKWRKFLTLLGLELRPLGLPARSQSLYRLSYPGSRAKLGTGTNLALIYSYINVTLSSSLNRRQVLEFRFRNPIVGLGQSWTIASSSVFLDTSEV